MQIKTLSKGKILIARPTLYDEIFNRSVILLTDHNEEGSVGFILNKPMDYSVTVFVSELESEAVVYGGGPVETENLYYLHNRPDLIANSEPICNGLYWSGDYEDVRNAVNGGWIQENEIRFYLGYSGWAKDQLQLEVDENAWIIVNDRVDIFKNWGNNLWRQQLKKLGGENLLWLNTPFDPGMN
ncbi:MAG: YqgE/AlgH family protein [Weeksellaceae bacterium]|jgi:putative transcriptional regulator|nr:YqgE/AlgH family protein [Weeksellaceae bacterium]